MSEKKPLRLCCCCSKRHCKLIFSFISAVIIPVSLGVMTIILSFQQESIAKLNRDVDLHIAGEEYRQNLELAADEQYNIHLTNYMREVTEILLAHNFTLSKLMLRLIIRPKTLATLRHIDPIRKGYLVRFLYESRLIALPNTSSLDLNGADLNSIHIGTYGYGIDMRQVYFHTIFLDNASFLYVSLGYAVFTQARLRNALFNICSVDYASFYGAQLQNADFNQTDTDGADFTLANMSGAGISERQLTRAGSISAAVLPDGSIGRNLNLFIDRDCQNSTDGNNIQQNVSVARFRTWFREVKRTGKLTYLFTAWFDMLTETHVNFTELNQRGLQLHKYCFGDKTFVANMKEDKSCQAETLVFSSAPPKNYTEQYKYVRAEVNIVNETYTINVNINLGQKGTCRDIHFSFET